MDQPNPANPADSATTPTPQYQQVHHHVSTVPTARHWAWCCPLCSLRSEQSSPDAFLRHLEDLHKEEIETKNRISPVEAETYQNELIQRAFESAHQQHPQQQDPEKHAFHHRPIKSHSFGTEFQRLRIGPQDKVIVDDQTPAATFNSHGADQSLIPDDVSRVATIGRQSSASPSSRLRHGQGPLHRSKPSRSVTRSSDQDFRQHTYQSREASRETNTPTSDAHDDARRKRQSQISQPTSSNASVSSPRQPINIPRHRGTVSSQVDPRWPDLILQPDSRGISEEQLAAEVRAIYQALTSLETRCIEYDKQHAVASQKGPLPPNTWRALIGIHRRLLNDHHDFFLASQHPSASAPLHRLALKYNMPARMWKHGIHVFLELLRHQLPHSLEFMISFIYMAYQMMSLLLETVPSFKETWIECLGDLSRYRMAVEEADMRDREQWGIVARYWYSQASDKLPNTGRLYHHLAILARPDALQQNHLFAKSLIAAQPFVSARESIQTLYDPVIKNEAPYVSEIDAHFIKISAFNFYKRYDEVAAVQSPFLERLNDHIATCGAKWKTMGMYVASVTIGAVLEYGVRSSMVLICDIGNEHIKAALSEEEPKAVTPQEESRAEADAEKAIAMAESFFFSTFAIVFARIDDCNTYTYAHLVLCFVLSLVRYDRCLHETPKLQARLRRFLGQVPWKVVCQLLNTLAQMDRSDASHETSDFPRPIKGEQGRLQEDFALRGMVFAAPYFPPDWFDDISADDDRTVEHPSTDRIRNLRLRWIGYKLFEYECLIYDPALRTWTPNEASPWAHCDASIFAGNANDGHLQATLPPDAIRMDETAENIISQGGEKTKYPIRSTTVVSALEKEKTTWCIDNITLHDNLDVFQYLTSNSWEVIIPRDMLNKLRELAKQQNGDFSATVAAVENSSARVVHSKGDSAISFRDVTSRTSEDSFDRPKREPTDEDEDDDWLMVDLIRRASDIKQHEVAAKQEADDRGARDYVIISNVESVQRYAQELNVPFVTSADIRENLMTDIEIASRQSDNFSDDAMDCSTGSP